MTALPRSNSGGVRSSAAPRPHVLVVDDETLMADSVAAILNRNGYDAVVRYSGGSALQYLDEGPESSFSRATWPRPAHRTGRGRLIELAAAEGTAFEFLSKPVPPAQLLQALQPGAKPAADYR